MSMRGAPICHWVPSSVLSTLNTIWRPRTRTNTWPVNSSTGAVAMRWIVEYARNRSEKSMMQRLAGELVDAFEKRGGAVRKTEDVHRMAEANRAFSHFRF